MKTPSVSVIIPVYNRQQTILTAVSSVLCQTCADFELLVVDDRSSDDTVKTIQSVNDQRVRLVLSPHNQGPAGARNLGVQQARGEYIAFLDSDDRWLPDALERMSAILDARVDAAGVLANHYLVENGVTTLGVRPFTESGARHFLMGMDFGPGSAMMVRCGCFNQIGLFNPDLRRGQDWEWVIRLYEAGLEIALDFTPVAVVERIYFANPEIVEAAHKQIITAHNHYFRSFGWRAYRKAVAHRYMLFAKQRFARRQVGLGFIRFLKGLTYWPFQRPGTLALVFDSLFGTRFSTMANRRRAVALPPEAQHDG